tara:strand:- start:47 stop:208 length:162 start_codon:yes stop_codon:yes gene_type:complete
MAAFFLRKRQVSELIAREDRCLLVVGGQRASGNSGLFEERRASITGRNRTQFI